MLIKRHTHPWSILDQLNRELSTVFHEEDNGRLAESNWNPLVDIHENEKDFSIKVDLPGIKPEDIELTAKDGVMSIQGERSESKEQSEEGKLLKSERFYGKFYREFKLPETADIDNIEARGKHGELFISIPKKSEIQAKRIDVKYAS